MSARPKGTDGRDFKYRETIDATYHQVAHARGVITRCLILHFGLAALRTIWCTTLNASVGRSPTPDVCAIAVLELVAVVLWRAARPGHARESLPLLKAFNIAQAAIATLQFLYTFEYYVADLRKLPDLGEVAASRLLDDGAISAASLPYWVDFFRGFTVFMDLTLLLFVMFGMRTAHVLILDKMQAQKARESKRAAALAAAGGAAGKPAAAVAAGGGRAADEAVATTTATAAKASDRTRARRRHA